MSPEDHDVLIEINTNLKNHLVNWENHQKEFRAHVNEDKQQFDWIKGVLYFGFGAIAVARIIFKI